MLHGANSKIKNLLKWRLLNNMITLHASTLPSYCDCPRRALLRIIPQELPYTFPRSRQNIASLVGTGFHAGAGYIMAGKLSGETASQSNAEEISITTMQEKIASDHTEYDATTPTANAAQQQIRTILNCFIHQAEPTIIPALPPEYSRRAKLTDEIEISGRIDTESTGAGIIDYKTGMLRNHFGQMGVYSLLRKTESESASRLSIWHFPRVPVKKPYPGAALINYPVPACEKIAWATIGFILRDINRFRKTGDPNSVPCNPCSVLCSGKYCQAWGTEFCEVTIK